MGLLPTKGIPLPFISSGNSSLLVFLCLSAVLARLGKDVWSKAQEPENAPQSLGHS
jgi:cell division protein FtsW